MLLVAGDAAIVAQGGRGSIGENAWNINRDTF
jgi:hypothetical protein